LNVIDVATASRAGVSRRRHRWQVARLLVASDLLAACVAALVAVAVVDSGPSSGEWPWILITTLSAPAAFVFYSLYERDRRQIAVSTLDEVRDVLNALGLVAFGQFVLGIGFGIEPLLPDDVTTVAVYWLVATPLIPISRAVLRSRVLPALTTAQNTIVVGAGFVGQTIAHKLAKHREYNLRVIGFLDDDPPPFAHPHPAPLLGGEDDLLDVIRTHNVTRVVLAFSRRTHEELLEVIRGAGLRHIHLSIVPRYFEIITANVGVADVEGIAILELPEAELSRLARWIKRTFDLVLTLAGLLLLLPLFLTIALLIKLDSRGPVFFRQPRMGRAEKGFGIYKFRTMVEGAESLRSSLLHENESSGPLFKIREDPRVTRVGRILRAMSLDELPQLLNVVRGEMSLVGPRPFVVHEDAFIGGWARRRLDLTPGITGLWQVLGRNDIGYDEMVKLDYLYVTNWSLWWDMKLLLRTVPIVFGRRGW
jgi:exopolysaccharide biosynthesis polyprenyl glycosylphosphotransferase